MSVSWDPDGLDFRNVRALVAETLAGTVPLGGLVAEVLDRIARSPRPEAWLHVASRTTLETRIATLQERKSKGEEMALFGVPFAIKDNIDHEGAPTTAGCPAFAYDPSESAQVVLRLEHAGAIAIGKTHLDQFATGLVGTRSPFGPCRNAHEPAFIAGGSSSGSAVVVAQGIVSFALGTDTAGSGRVPAALNGIVGLKPTRGGSSLRGIVPACASLDCVSIFANDCPSADAVWRVIAGFDPEDPYSRRSIPSSGLSVGERFVFGVPERSTWRELCPENSQEFEHAVEQLEKIGGQAVEIDWQPFARVAELLYEGPWVAERLASVGDFAEHHRESVDPVVASVLDSGRSLSARDAFDGFNRLATLRRSTEAVWDELACLVVPTVPRTWRIEEVLQNPIETNTILGRTNNFLNLLDLVGLALPSGRQSTGVPFGVTLCAPAGRESNLLALGGRLEALRPRLQCPSAPSASIPLVVVGAHLRGMPLNDELLQLGARFVGSALTHESYRLYALPDSQPPKPGLCRVAEGGVCIEVEVWRLSPDAFGAFVARVPAPLAIGTLTLDDGTSLPGFVCEPAGLDGALDVSQFGGWRAYIASRAG